jgi:excisionase family DNA binding protein
MDQPPIDPDADYAPEEVAAIKGVTYASVVAAIGRGELAATKTGRGWTIRGRDVAAWNPWWWHPRVPDRDRN